MADYIKRDDVIDVIMSQFCASSDETEAVLNNTVKEVKEIPPADVVERKKGKWVPQLKSYGDRAYLFPTCTVCGHQSPLKNNFCPHCGAEMVGE